MFRATREIDIQIFPVIIKIFYTISELDSGIVYFKGFDYWKKLSSSEGGP